MKRLNSRSRLAAMGGGIALALTLAGCGQSKESADAAPAAEVRGEPIVAAAAQSESATSAVVPAPEVAVPRPTTGGDLNGGGPAVVAGVVPEAKTSPGPGATVSAASSEGGTGTPERPLAVSFEKLAEFSYDVPDGPVDTNTVVDAKLAGQIPSTIKALNEQFVSLKGFMLPLKVEKGLVTELLVMRDQSMCCYGTVPRINEWVSVKMVGEGVKPIMDQPITLFGKLKVGEMFENGYLVGIYAMEGDRMAGPLDM